MLSEETLSKLFILARQAPNVEVCGVILEDFSIVPIKNISSNNNAFVFDKFEWLPLLNYLKREDLGILCVYHSHPSGDLEPSTTDLLSQKNFKKDFIIVNKFNQYREVKYYA